MLLIVEFIELLLELYLLFAHLAFEVHHFFLEVGLQLINQYLLVFQKSSCRWFEWRILNLSWWRLLLLLIHL